MRTDRLNAIIEGLNDAQRAAVEHRDGPLLVLAGAGSGKTRVIIVRIAEQVARRVNPNEVLALTFTNKAAGEMRERISSMVGEESAGQMTMGTFHALGLRMLDEDGAKVGLPRRFTLLDASDQATAVRQCLRRLRLDPKRHDPRALLTAISRFRHAGLSPDQAGEDMNRQIAARVYRAYLEWLEAYRAVDFDDLILRPVQMLREDAAIRDKWRGRFRTILVDEYQDTSGMQLELVRLLAEEHRQLTVVGDDDQSIYGWRGACIQNILDFERHFPDATTIKLTQNYRSSAHILACANAVIGHNTGRKAKELWTHSDQGEPVRVVVARDDRAEANFVASRLHRMMAEGRPGSDFAVLFRASTQAARLEEALRLVSVPYRVVGAFDFFERKEVKDLLAYLRLVDNPRDRAGLVRIINFPRRGIGPASLAALQAFADQHAISTFRALGRAGEIGGLTGPVAGAMKSLHATIAQVREGWKSHGNLVRLARDLVEETGAREAWIRDPTEGPGGQGRWKSIELVLDALASFQEAQPSGSLRDWLRLVTLDRRTPGDEDDRPLVTLMSIHASKGLEWPVVFVVGCEEGLLPHHRVIEESGDVDEERRLFYVAMTRAEEELFITRARARRTFRGQVPNRPSRFIADLPDDHVALDDRGEGGGSLTKEETLDRFAALRARLTGKKEGG